MDNRLRTFTSPAQRHMTPSKVGIPGQIPKVCSGPFLNTDTRHHKMVPKKSTKRKEAKDEVVFQHIGIF